MELETLIRETLREHAADAPTRIPDVAGRPRRWLYAGLAAALVAGLAVGAVALRSADSHSPSSASIPAAPNVPAGYKPISYHGITLAVPANLTVYGGGCLTPTGGYVLVDAGYIGSCPLNRASTGTPEVSLEPTERATHDLVGTSGHGLTTRQVTVDGRSGTRRTHNAYTETGPLPSSGELTLPDPGVVVEVRSNWTTVQAVLNSVHITPTNYLGCKDHDPRASVDDGDSLLPTGATDAVVCVYDPYPDAQHARWLVGSAAVPGATRADLVRQLHDLRVDPLGKQEVADQPWIALIFRYGDGRSIQLLVGGQDAPEQWFIFGSRRVAEDQRLQPLSELVQGVR